MATVAVGNILIDWLNVKAINIILISTEPKLLSPKNSFGIY